ncbi:quinone oxidoreductase, putative [Janibacter sp. HTCC2649]|uniref:quinone oxidoreductase family protein n=1 Tax=Janibacter sp. HTCC2649 TaxID=313589 RepID=UPI0000670EAC|nr:quinone oxidoreductase [Janibacter sp. HTCC2649]EAP97319.1 quinone oxidoreductase, putative [Janibacter sp. HTCC2649]
MTSGSALPESAPALVVTAHGGGDVLEVREQALPVPGSEQVLVRVAAAGVNFIDTYQREGVYPIPTPFVCGAEGAGEVVAVGPDVNCFVIGDRVAWGQGLGSAQAYAAVDTKNLVHVPQGVDLETAAAAMLQGLTAHYLSTSTYAVQQGTVALVHAAAGGVGQLLTQMVKKRGGRVIATAGSAEKLETARERGADELVNYAEVDDLAATVRELTDGVGVHVVYDGVGLDTFEASLNSLRPRGLMVLYGAASGQVPPFDLQRLNKLGSLFVTRPTLGSYVATPEELRARATELFEWIESGDVQVSVGGRYPLAEARTAYADLEGRRTQGKLLLIP